MRLELVVAATLGLVLPACLAGAAQSRGPADGQGATSSTVRPPSEARPEDPIARAIEASSPGPEQRWLEPLVGTWKVDMTFFSAAPAAQHMVGTSQNRWILGGRFLICDLAAEGAPPMEATMVYGYDARERRFFALGLSNLATRYNQWAGTYDPRDRSFILSGKDRDEASGLSRVVRQQVKIESPDRYSLRMFVDAAAGAPIRIFEATFTRR